MRAAVLVVAVAAAVRSTWSPCGWSVLSTLTPLAERSRGHRYLATSAWYVLGATLGGLCLGTLGAAVAAAVHLLGLTGAAALTIGGTAALVAAVSDSNVFRAQLPGHERQVNEDWIEAYRPWVYGTGFGWQIGVGLATYIRTAAVYLAVVLAALTGSPLAALSAGAVFGAVRGLAVFLSARCGTPQLLLAFHRRFAAADPWSRELTAATSLAVGLGLLAGVASWSALALGCAALVKVVLCGRSRQAGSSRSPDKGLPSRPLIGMLAIPTKVPN